MKSYSGPVFTEGGFIQGKVEVMDGEIIQFEEGGEGGEDAILIPSLIDAHTHSGDAFVKSAPDGTIEEVVGPGGKKHQALQNASEETLIEGIRRYYHEMIDNGVLHAIEFREGGVDGINILKEGVRGLEEYISISIFGRPSKKSYDEWELNKLISMCDGIGLSSYRDWDEVQFHKIAETARQMGTPFALHCSEDVREPLEKIIDLGIHHLVHMIEAEEDDLLTCAIEDIPIVICPRSNMQFGKIPDIPSMLENDVILSLGTDNAMLASPDMFREMETAYRVARMNGGLEAEEILRMATWNPRETLYPSLNVAESDPHKNTYLVLDRKGGDPAYEVVTRSSKRDIKETVVW